MLNRSVPFLCGRIIPPDRAGPAGEGDSYLKLATTLWGASMVTVQVSTPEQPPPDQPAKAELGPAAAMRVTRVPGM